MTNLTQISEANAALIKAHPGLPPDMDVFVRGNAADIEGEITSALERLGMCVYCMPVLPRQVTTGQDTIFFEAVEIRVRLLVDPTLNQTGLNSGEAMAHTMLALHGKNPGGLLSGNQRLANPPCELVDDPGLEIYDILLTGAFPLD